MDEPKQTNTEQENTKQKATTKKKRGRPKKTEPAKEAKRTNYVDVVLGEKLTYIQSKLKAPKNQYNKFGGYNYRNCEDILEALKPLLVETNTTLVVKDEIVLVGDRYYVRATAILNDGHYAIESTAYAREPANKKGMDEAQITGATSSYARKYALNGLFAIDDTKDADSTNQHSDKPAAGQGSNQKTSTEKTTVKKPVATKTTTKKTNVSEAAELSEDAISLKKGNQVTPAESRVLNIITEKLVADDMVPKGHIVDVEKLKRFVLSFGKGLPTKDESAIKVVEAIAKAGVENVTKENDFLKDLD